MLVGHICGTVGGPPSSMFAAVMARLGVSIFFVISGFLITGLLLDEHRATNTVSLRGFYIRRAIRIVPAFLVFVTVMFVADLIGLIQIRAADFIAALTYTTNYLPNRSWELGHVWSLSVEEQFYLLWPAAIAWLGFRRGLHVAIAMFVAAPVVRIAIRLLLPHTIWESLELFPAVCDAIAIGCIVAILRDKLSVSKSWKLITQAWASPVLLTFVFFTFFFDGFAIVDLIMMPLAMLAIAALVEGATRFQGIAKSVLNSRPMIFIGTLSYSLYLWQQPFLDRHSVASFRQFPLNLIATIGCALLSYYAVERPFLALRSRMARRWRYTDSLTGTHLAVRLTTNSH